MAVKVVGLVSSYMEGELVQGAVGSLREARLDGLLVYEGPAGPPLPDWTTAPASNLEGIAHRIGRWRTDARKRDQMLQEAKAAWPGEELWGVWLDGDEILWGAVWLRDILQAVSWRDEAEKAAAAESGAEWLPTIRWPLRKIEPDGSLSTTGSRLARLDLLRSIDVSVSVVTNSRGIEEGWGDVVEDSALWVEHFMGAIDRGRMVGWPPLPTEPCIVHRSHLRHPARAGLRMHHQEADELRKAGKLE